MQMTVDSTNRAIVFCAILTAPWLTRAKMPFLKCQGLSSTCILGRRSPVIIAAIVLIGAFTVPEARAEMLYLKCGDAGTFDVDLSKSTVNGNPAKITSSAIAWTLDLSAAADGTTGRAQYSIDRTTGKMLSMVWYIRPSGKVLGPAISEPTCGTIPAPKTRF
jgi:hypothetical protein